MLFVGDNTAYSGSVVDTYPDNAKAFTYKLSGGSQRPTSRPVSKNITINVKGSKKIQLSASDVDNDSLSFRIIEKPAHGTLTATNEARSILVYHPDAGFSGDDSFRFVANDGTYDSSIHRVSLKIAADGGSESGSSESGGSLPIEWVVMLGMIVFWRRRKSAMSALL